MAGRSRADENMLEHTNTDREGDSFMRIQPNVEL